MNTKEIIGTVTYEKDFVFHKTYSYAAWFSNHLVPAGTYNVYAKEHSWSSNYILVETTVVDAYFKAHFGGNPFGDDPAGKAKIGTKETIFVPVFDNQLKKI